MRFAVFLLCAIVTLEVKGPCEAQESDAVAEEPNAVICGTVFWYGDHKSPDKEVFIFNFEKSTPLRDLARKTSERLRSLGSGAFGTEGVELDFYDKVADLVPKLSATAKTKSDKSGSYKFANLAPGKRYYIVALDVSEEGVFYAARTTPILKGGQRLRIDLREINLWYANEK